MSALRSFIVALLAGLLSFVASPATAQDYGPFGVFGSPSGAEYEEGDDINVVFEAVDLDCDSWTVTSDNTGEAPGGGGSGSVFSFTVSPDAGSYSITAQCNTNTSSLGAGGSRGSLGTVVAGAGETFDTATFRVVEEGSDDDNGDGDGDGDGDEDGGLPNTGGSGFMLLALGGILATVGAVTFMSARRRGTI